MTTGPGVYQHGGGAPPLENAASDVLERMRGAMGPSPAWPAPLTAEDREEAQQAERCQFCAGIHGGMSSPGCPRLASFKLDGDGKVTEGTFWPGTDWAKGRVVLAEDAHEDSEEEAGGD